MLHNVVWCLCTHWSVLNCRQVKKTVEQQHRHLAPRSIVYELVLILTIADTIVTVAVFDFCRFSMLVTCDFLYAQYTYWYHTRFHSDWSLFFLRISMIFSLCLSTFILCQFMCFLSFVSKVSQKSQFHCTSSVSMHALIAHTLLFSHFQFIFIAFQQQQHSALISIYVSHTIMQ